jgi:hypothetical protein
MDFIINSGRENDKRKIQANINLPIKSLSDILCNERISYERDPLFSKLNGEPV